MERKDRKCNERVASPNGDLEGPDLEVAHSMKEHTSHSHSQEEVFFASGPFYAHLDDLDDDEDDELMNTVKTRGSSNLRSPFDDVDHNGRRSNTKCNVFYAEMPHSFRTVSSSSATTGSVHSKSQSPGGTPSSGGKLKLKNLLMFGGNGSSHHKNATSTIDHCDSFCCQAHNVNDLVESPLKHEITSKQYRKTPFLPKLNPFNRILSSSQELFSHKHKNASESSIRVIKPTAIRPTLVVGLPKEGDYYETVDDTSTSADFYELTDRNRSQGNRSFESATSRQPSTSSAFHQVNSLSSASNSTKYAQHNRSNSLVESFVYPLNHLNAATPPLPPQRSVGKSTTTSTSPRPRSSDGRRNSRGIDHIGFSEQQGSSLDNLDVIHSQKRQPIDSEQEPIHMTLEEVRRIAFGSGSLVAEQCASSSTICDISNEAKQATASGSSKHSHKSKLKLAFENILHKTHCIGPNSPSGSSLSGSSSVGKNVYKVTSTSEQSQEQSMLSFIPNGYRRINIEDQSPLRQPRIVEEQLDRSLLASPFIRRALPPLPRDHEERNARTASTQKADQTPTVMDQLRSQGYRTFLAGFGSNRAVPLSLMTHEERQRFLDYATSIERVKNCGWYWGPVCGEMAEKLLETEPCGSFIVRDSSDEHYIFSLTFKLNGIVRHVRIEHDQGNFSFGSLQKYRSNTIVDFIESAVEHSRNGQFLFFLHRQSNGNPIEPVLPVRVQLLNPISRFRQVQSLQHNCRFIILKHVRRDQIHQLPLPEFLHSYLDTPYYYSEELANLQESMKREKAEGKKEEEKRRQAFMRTDQRILVAKMLIDRAEIERQLQIVLPAEVYGGMGSKGASTTGDEEHGESEPTDNDEELPPEVAQQCQDVSSENVQK